MRVNIGTIVFFSFVFLGSLALFFLPVRLFPKSGQAIIKVSTIYPGASPDTNFSLVSQILAKKLVSVPGVDYILGDSGDTVSTLELNLAPNANLERALTETLAKIQESRFELPQEIYPPMVEVLKPDSRVADMYISFFSEKLQSFEVADTVNRIFLPRLAAIPGVQKVELIGETAPAVKFVNSIRSLEAMKISQGEVQRRLSSSIQSIPSGWIDVNRSRLNFSILNIPDTVWKLGEKPVRVDGGIYRFRDAGTFKIEPENADSEARFNGQTSVFAGVFVDPQANALTVLNAVKKTLDSVKQANLFEGEVQTPYDSSIFIRASLKEISKTLIETVIIVGLVVFASLKNIRYGFVVFLAIPLSLLGVMPMLYLAGFSINLLTILAIVLSVGIVVDDSILVVEDVVSRISRGESRSDAIKGAIGSLWKPMLILNLCLIVLFLPFFFQTGLTADLFKEFAFAFIMAAVTSLIVALTVIPMLLRFNISDSSKFMSPEWSILKEKQKNILVILMKRANIVLVCMGLILLSLPIVVSLPPRDFLPKEDRSVVLTFVDVPRGISPSRMREILDEWYDVVSKIPDIRHVFQLGSINFNFGGVGLKPYNERDLTAFDVERELFLAGSRLTSARLVPINPPPLPSSGTFPVEFALTSPNVEPALLALCDHISNQMRRTGMFGFVDCVPKANKPVVRMTILEEKLSRYGIPLDFFSRELGAVTVERFVALYPSNTRAYRVYTQLNLDGGLDALKLTPFFFNGERYFFGSFLNFELVSEFDSYKQFDQYYAVILRAAPTPGVPLGTSVKVAQELIDGSLPNVFQREPLGDTRQFLRNIQESRSVYVFAIGLIVALFLAYTKSFILTVVSVGSALVMSFWLGHFVNLMFGFSVNFYSTIGMLILIGLVAKNYVIIIDKALGSLRLSPESDINDVVISASLDRLRPVIMTSVSTILGHFPLILATGAGAVARNCIGVTLVGSMFVLTIFSVLVYPVLLSFGLKIVSKIDAFREIKNS